MASSSFTTNLHLNAWADTDRPKRADFLSDNNIIDTQLGGHILNSTIHLTPAEKAKVTDPFACVVYVGSGAAERDIQLGFLPKFVAVYKRGVPPVVYSDGVNTVNTAFGCYGHGISAGIGVSSTGITVYENASASNGVRVSLNESGSQYTVVAFK